MRLLISLIHNSTPTRTLQSQFLEDLLSQWIPFLFWKSLFPCSLESSTELCSENVNSSPHPHFVTHQSVLKLGNCQNIFCDTVVTCHASGKCFEYFLYSDIIEIIKLLPLEPLETHTKIDLSIDLHNPESLCILNCM